MHPRVPTYPHTLASICICTHTQGLCSDTSVRTSQKINANHDRARQGFQTFQPQISLSFSSVFHQPLEILSRRHIRARIHTRARPLLALSPRWEQQPVHVGWGQAGSSGCLQTQPIEPPSAPQTPHTGCSRNTAFPEPQPTALWGPWGTRAAVPLRAH